MRAIRRLFRALFTLLVLYTLFVPIFVGGRGHKYLLKQKLLGYVNTSFSLAKQICKLCHLGLFPVDQFSFFFFEEFFQLYWYHFWVFSAKKVFFCCSTRVLISYFLQTIWLHYFFMKPQWCGIYISTNPLPQQNPPSVKLRVLQPLVSYSVGFFSFSFDLPKIKGGLSW